MSTSPRRPLPSRITAPVSPSRPLPRRIGDGPMSPPRASGATVTIAAPTVPVASTVPNRLSKAPAEVTAPTSPGRPLPKRINTPVVTTTPVETTPEHIVEPVQQRTLRTFRPAPRLSTAPVTQATPAQQVPEPVQTGKSLTFRLDGGKITKLQLVDSQTILVTIA